MENLFYGSLIGFIVLIIYLYHRATVKGKEIEANEHYYKRDFESGKVEGKEIEANEHYYKLGNELREFYKKYPNAHKYENDPEFVGITKDGLLEFFNKMCCATYHLSPEDIAD